MRWGELDLDGAMWSLPRERTRNGLPHDVPLSGEALAILRAVTRMPGRELVFGSGEGPFSAWSSCKAALDGKIAKARAAARLCRPMARGERPDPKLDALPEWRLHDLRRTLVTGMNDLDVPPHVVEAVVNHVSGEAKRGVAGTYNHAKYNRQKRRALDLWAAHVAALVAGEPPKVVPLRPPAAVARVWRAGAELHRLAGTTAAHRQHQPAKAALILTLGGRLALVTKGCQGPGPDPPCGDERRLVRARSSCRCRGGSPRVGVRPVVFPPSAEGGGWFCLRGAEAARRQRGRPSRRTVRRRSSHAGCSGWSARSCRSCAVCRAGCARAHGGTYPTRGRERRGAPGWPRRRGTRLIMRTGRPRRRAMAGPVERRRDDAAISSPHRLVQPHAAATWAGGAVHESHLALCGVAVPPLPHGLRVHPGSRRRLTHGPTRSQALDRHTLSARPRADNLSNDRSWAEGRRRPRSYRIACPVLMPARGGRGRGPCGS
jgi:hypothetical protein